MSAEEDLMLKRIQEYLVRRICRMFPGTASEANARADGQAEVGQMLAGLINDLNSFVGNSSVGKDRRVPKKVSGKMGIEEMVDYLRLRIKDMVFDLEVTHRGLVAAKRIIDNATGVAEDDDWDEDSMNDY